MREPASWGKQASCPRRRDGQESQGGLGHGAGAQRIIQCGQGSIPGQRLQSEATEKGPEALEHKILMIHLQMVLKMRTLDKNGGNDSHWGTVLPSRCNGTCQVPLVTNGRQV